MMIMCRYSNDEHPRWWSITLSEPWRQKGVLRATAVSAASEKMDIDDLLLLYIT